MKGICDTFIKWAKENNWHVVDRSDMPIDLCDNIISRYHKIPSGYLEFLKIAKQLISPSEKSWFICEDEYNDQSDIAFRWNEFEVLSLDAAEDDQEWKTEIIEWWDNYLPIVMSVDEGYSYYAIKMGCDKGTIVRGLEPEFEEVEHVADTIEDFFQAVMSQKIFLR